MVDDGKVSVKTPDTSQDPVLSLVYGSTLMEFEAEMEARDQFKKATSSSWDYSNQEIIEEESQDPSLTEEGNLSSSKLADVIGLDPYPMQHAGKISDEQLKAWSNRT